MIDAGLYLFEGENGLLQAFYRTRRLNADDHGDSFRGRWWSSGSFTPFVSEPLIQGDCRHFGFTKCTGRIPLFEWLYDLR